MANPIVEMFVNSLESKIRKHYLINLDWCRYVDDIACFTGTQRQLEVFRKSINSLDPNIKFTSKLENNIFQIA